jgi:arylsulfatase A-like enzyme
LKKHIQCLAVVLVALAQAFAATPQGTASPKKRNVIIFVADGLRHGSVNEMDTPALWLVRTKGVHFENSYSLFPTFTTANASAIATGHRLGDTGDFSNGLDVGYPIFDTGNFNRGPGTTIPFIENNEILADLDSHFGGNYLNEITLLEAAQKAGFNTAAIGKGGPAAIQAVAEISPQGERFPVPETVIIDDSTAYSPWDPVNKVAKSIPLPQELVDRMVKLEIPLDAPGRSNGFPEHSAYANGYAGNAQTAGTLRPNYVQQDWMLEVTTRAVLPMFTESGKPFVVLFWSRDPDATQHNQGDSFQQLVPGVNGPTSAAAVKNSDRTLAALLEWLDKNPEVKANTDVFVTSDHGFATVSRRELDRAGAMTKSQAAQHFYRTSSGQLDTNRGFLPSGFLAIDLAWAMQTKLWDPDSPSPAGTRNAYKEVHLRMDEFYKPTDEWERPLHGNGLLGQNVYKADGSDAMAILAANGGSDLIYVPDKNPETVKRIVSELLKFDYVANIFVDDMYSKPAGTLPLSAIDLVGSAVVPRPAILVGFKTFYLNPGNLMQGVQISDTSLQEGQGNHGGFGRESTWNNMAAIGPDFKQGSVDRAPVGNADIVPTLAKILGLEMPSKGKLRGRVIGEALKGHADVNAPEMTWLASEPAGEKRTVMFLQEFGGQKYFSSSCMVTAKSIEAGVCEKQ